jgi:hypothetical protein
MKNVKLLLFIGVLMLSFISCKKEVPSEEMPKEVAALIKEFNLQTEYSGIKSNLKFETIAQARKFLCELRDSISDANFVGKVSLIDGLESSKGGNETYIITPPSFEEIMKQNSSTKDAGTLWTTRMTAGILSDFVLTFTADENHNVDCGTVTMTVSGLAIGWSWEQTTSSCSGCGGEASKNEGGCQMRVFGNVVWGFEVLGVELRILDDCLIKVTPNTEWTEATWIIDWLDEPTK